MMEPKNALSGLQVVALHGLLTTGEGLGPPTTSTSTAAFEAIPTVSAFKSMLTAAATAGLSESELWTLNTIGADSVPSLFGSIPSSTSAPSANDPGLQPGFALDQIAARTTDLFPPGEGPSKFIQIFTQASGYASMSYDVLKSAATATFGSFSNPGTLITGGLTNIVGETQSGLVSFGQGLQQTGDLLDVDNLTANFSAAGTIKTVLDTGVDQVGNLHAKVLGQVLTRYDGSPVLDNNGKEIIITRELVERLVNEPVSTPESDADGPLPSTVDSTVYNPIDMDLARFIDRKLSPTELNAIKSLNKIQSDTPLSHFTEFLTPSIQLGSDATTVLQEAGIDTSDPTAIVDKLQTSIGGINNISNIGSLADACQNLEVLDSSFNLIKDLSVPLSYDEFAELVGAMGGGTGMYGNAQISDFLGGDPTKGIAAVADTVAELATLPESVNIASDLSLLQSVLAGGPFPITFSDSTIANTISEAVTYGSTAINNAAAAVKAYADTNNISQTLTQYTTAIASSNIGELLYSKANIDTSSITADVGSIVGFVSSLHGIANDSLFGGYDVIKRFADPATKAGQAILASLSEGKNLSVLQKAGIKIDNFNSIPNYVGDGIGTSLPQPGSPGVPPPPNPIAPVPNPGATEPRILSVRAYRPGTTDRAEFEIRYEGITNWQTAGFLIMSDELNQVYVTVGNNEYPPLPASYGVITFKQNMEGVSNESSNDTLMQRFYAASNAVKLQMLTRGLRTPSGEDQYTVIRKTVQNLTGWTTNEFQTYLINLSSPSFDSTLPNTPSPGSATETGYVLPIYDGTQIDVVILNRNTGAWITPTNGFQSTMRCPMTSYKIAWPPEITSF